MNDASREMHAICQSVPQAQNAEDSDSLLGMFKVRFCLFLFWKFLYILFPLSCPCQGSVTTRNILPWILSRFPPSCRQFWSHAMWKNTQFWSCHWRAKNRRFFNYILGLQIVRNCGFECNGIPQTWKLIPLMDNRRQDLGFPTSPSCFLFFFANFFLDIANPIVKEPSLTYWAFALAFSLRFKMKFRLFCSLRFPERPVKYPICWQRGRVYLFTNHKIGPDLFTVPFMDFTENKWCQKIFHSKEI